MSDEVREERTGSRGRVEVLWVQKRRDNHYLDWELMLHAAAVISGILRPALAADPASAEEIEDATSANA